MAEDDKYVPSGGNPKLDVASAFGSAVSRALDKQQAEYEKNRDAGRAANVAGLIRQQEKSMAQDGLEYDSEGTLRSSGPNGYENSFDYRRKEATKAERAHITERTWGKYNRGETLDMYGKKQGAPRPRKKSDISASISPDYGQFKPKSTTLANASSGSIGLVPWITRFHPSACGPVLVSTFGNSGGAFQSNAQEAINNGFPVNSFTNFA